MKTTATVAVGAVKGVVTAGVVAADLYTGDVAGAAETLLDLLPSHQPPLPIV